MYINEVEHDHVEAKATGIDQDTKKKIMEMYSNGVNRPKVIRRNLLEINKMHLQSPNFANVDLRQI